MNRRKDKKTISDGRKKRKLFKSDKRKVNKALYIAIGLVVVVVAVFVLGIVTSQKIRTKNFIIEYGNLPKNFDGYKIAQITDYHLGVYANDNSALVSEIVSAQPDIITLTGDFVDSSSEDIDNVTDLVDSLVEIAPIIWIKGNHYYKTDELVAKEFSDMMDSKGVISLTNESHVVTIDSESIMFCGVDDPEKLYSMKNLPKEYSKVASEKAMERFLDEIDTVAEDDSVWFKVLLSHRYSIYEEFPQHGYSLTLAGHSHGGQLKLPWGLDIIGYDLSLFPKVKSGYNDIEGMPLIVSSGLGVSNLNLRLYNPPEVVVIELKSK